MSADPGAQPGLPNGRKVELGLRQNLAQFTLLVAVNALVGGMVGQEQTVLPLLAADEPVAGLDPDAQLMILDLLRGHAGAGGGVLLTLHDLTLAARYCDRIVVLKAGRMAAAGAPADALTAATLAGVFDLAGGLIDTEAGPVLAGRYGVQSQSALLVGHRHHQRPDPQQRAIGRDRSPLGRSAGSTIPA